MLSQICQMKHVSPSLLQRAILPIQNIVSRVPMYPWYFTEDCLPRTLDRPLVQYFTLYILRTKIAVSVKQLHRFFKNLEVLLIQKILS